MLGGAGSDNYFDAGDILTKKKHYSKKTIIIMLEFAQYGIIGFIIGYFVGQIINDYLLIEFNKDKYITEEHSEIRYNNNPLLWKDILQDVAIVSISIYFVKQIVNIVPFIFSFLDKKYRSNNSNTENIAGFTIGIGFVYSRTLDNLNQKLDILMGERTWYKKSLL